MTSFPRSTLLTCTSSWTSIFHDLEASSPKCGLNYHTTFFLSFQSTIPQKTPILAKRWKLKGNNSISDSLSISQGFKHRQAAFLQAAALPVLDQPEGLPPIRINTSILFMGISLEQVLHWSNNLHVRWITWLLINDTIDTSTSEIRFL